VLLGVIGWNYVLDSEAHMTAARELARIEAEKIDLHDLKPLRADILRLCDKHDHDMERVIDKLEKGIDEIKAVVMKKYPTAHNHKH
jgi:hypothetical protein